MGAAVRIIVEVAPGAVLVKCACAGTDGEREDAKSEEL